MAVVAGLLAGFLTARLAWVLLRGTLSAEAFRRQNYRGHELPTAAGVVVVAAVLGVEAGRAAVGAAGMGDTAVITSRRLLVLVAVVGYALLGLADDLGAAGATRGFRGHARSFVRGHLTTGGLKLLGGGMLAVILAGPAGGLGGRQPGPRALGWLLVDATVIALAANLANLFDRAPGRAAKVGALGFALLAAAAALDGDLKTLAGVAVVVGATLGLLLDDLHEHLMLGDTGANAVGAALGVGVVTQCAPQTRLLVAAVLLLLNLLSEVVSFTVVIDRIAPLRSLDRAGTLPVRRAAASRPSGRRTQPAVDRERTSATRRRPVGRPPSTGRRGPQS